MSKIPPVCIQKTESSYDQSFLLRRPPAFDQCIVIYANTHYCRTDLVFYLHLHYIFPNQILIERNFSLNKFFVPVRNIMTFIKGNRYFLVCKVNKIHA